MSVVDVLIEADRPLAYELTAAVESASEHPIGRAFAAALDEIRPVEAFSSTQGQGVRGVVDGSTVVTGRPSWLVQEWSIAIPPTAHDWIDDQRGRGRTVVATAVDGSFGGAFAIADAVKDSSAQAVSEIKELVGEPILVTGDNAPSAQVVADQLGIGAVVADVLPESKIAVVRDLQAQGKYVAMVGDGVNDAAALAQADLGIAMGSGSDVAIEASDITLVRSDPRSIVDAIRLSRRTLSTIKGNLFWAFAYNIASIPLAMAGLLNPMIAGAAMAFSSVFVVGNSLRLRGFQPTG
jgi:Cu+-exporting ATPase